MTSYTRSLQTRRKKGHIRERPEFRQRVEAGKQERLRKQLEKDARQQVRDYEAEKT